MKYSFNQNKEGVVFAHAKDLNASFKDLGAVCDSIRYMSVPVARVILEEASTGKRAILYKKHNKHMGARHELGGRKGRWPIKCANIVRKVLVNAINNAENKGMDPDGMYVVHACANKTNIARRMPPKGALFPTALGMMGYATRRASDLEFAKVEIGISELNEKRLAKSTVSRVRYVMSSAPKVKIEEKAKNKKGKDKKEKEQKGKEKDEKKGIITKVEQKEQVPAQKEEQKKEIVSEKKEPASVQPKAEEKVKQ
ncbi:MAG: 50S ribosomal protein L22 [Candidatus Marsarchaeota archaeon]|nr:50S ribosomal protein L22 [Candidatus Marsarchaeota archaeon]